MGQTAEITEKDALAAESVLLDLVTVSLYKSISMPLITKQVDWEILLEQAACQGVFAFVADVVRSLPPEQQPPAEYRIKLALGLERIQRRYSYQADVLASLADFYRSEGVEMVLLKGLGFSLMYPTPNLRESGDLDIYLCGNFSKGNELMEASGITVMNKEGKHSNFTFKNVSVENHRVFTDKSVFHSLNSIDEYLIGQLENGKEYCTKLKVYLPPVTFNVLHILRHAQTHIIIEGIVLRHLCDWALFIRQNPSFLADEHLIKLLKKYGLFNVFEAFNHLSKTKLRADICYVASKRNRQFAEYLWEDIVNQGRRHNHTFVPNRGLIAKVKSKFRTFRSMLGRKRMLDYLGAKVFVMAFVDRCCTNFGLLKYGDNK